MNKHIILDIEEQLDIMCDLSTWFGYARSITVQEFADAINADDNKGQELIYDESGLVVGSAPHISNVDPTFMFAVVEENIRLKCFVSLCDAVDYGNDNCLDYKLEVLVFDEDEYHVINR